jgi:hypothetical protein
VSGFGDRGGERDVPTEAETYISGLEPSGADAYVHCFALSSFLTGVLPSVEWNPPAGIADAVALTTAGEHAERLLIDQGFTATADERRLGVLGAFARKDLLIEPAGCDRDALESMISQALNEGSLRLVWDFGFEFSARVVDLFGGHRASLTPDEAQQLLAGLPQGVWQVATLIGGPYGLLKSAEVRRLLPDVHGGAIPCRDPACTNLHSVPLPRDASKILSAERVIASGMPMPVNTWFRVFDLLTGDRERYLDDMNPAALAVTLANGFTPAERSRILADLIREDSESIRAAAAANPTLSDVFRASADNIAASAGEAETLQLLLLVPDALLVNTVERVIDAGDITIPLTEIRDSVYTLRRLDNGLWRVTCEVASQGVRFRPTTRDVSLLRLRRLIVNVYNTERDASDLQWKLATVVTSAHADPLDEYLRRETPENVLHALILQNRDTLERAFQHLGLGNFTLPRDRESVRRVAQKILWKLGFAVQEFPDILPRLWEQHTANREISARYAEPYDTRAQHAIRGVAVNFFVHLEEVLDLTLSYVTWALLHDHYGQPRRDRFRFDLEAARAFTVNQLSGRLIGADELVLRADGKNTLFPLVAGLGELAKLAHEKLSADVQSSQRAATGFPFWAERTDLETFPFLHTLPLLDISAPEREEVIRELEAVPAVFSRGNVLDVRNRLEHKRDPFPDRSEIEGALSAIEACIASLEAVGICPSVYLPTRSRAESPGRSELVLRDYRGVEHSLFLPSRVGRVSLPVWSEGQLIFKGARLAGTDECLRFRYSEPSEFRTFWKAASHLELSADRSGMEVVADADEHTNGQVLGSVAE